MAALSSRSDTLSLQNFNKFSFSAYLKIADRYYDDRSNDILLEDVSSTDNLVFDFNSQDRYLIMSFERCSQ